ncbi:MAG: threonylcarbamoyl-AMP synthase [Candidatus Methylomirabilota bacterium]|nr:threonylcarbamoyl-AMP synthase [candidate division NC10 bacterium]PWB48930.1 MAG: threonylcarbamoyl-AMP synthase [candidate division NC10 bacterium]
MVRVGADTRPDDPVARYTVSPEAPSEALIERGATALRHGSLVAFPTDTLYALGADASNPRAIEQIFVAKGRSFNNPIPLLVADVAMATRLAGTFPEAAARLAERYWPGPLTLVVPAPPTICPLLTAGTGRIGLRAPDAAVALALIRHFGGAITGTSANRSGGREPLDADEVLRQLGNRVEVVLDGGPAAGGSPSTVIDVTISPPVVLRSGPILHEEILRLLGFQAH